MGRINYKIGIIIIIYSLFITSIFIVGTSLFQNFISTDNTGTLIGRGVYLLNDEEMFKTYIDGTASVKAAKVLSIAEVDNYYTNNLLRTVPVITGGFCLVLIGATYALWTVLKYVQKKETMKIVGNLEAITLGDKLVAVDPAISEAYDKIKRKFDENLNSYKRLNSYLSHEQKNAIAILRTNLELSGDFKYLRSLDNISNSIDDILTLSDSDEYSQKTEVDVALVCASVCDEYSKISENINFKFNEEDNTLIFARERWIYRAVSNVVDNAVKYGEGKPIEVTIKNKNNTVIIEVCDHGIGMDGESLEKIFSHRYRVSELNKDGYGIGLSLVSHVCDLCDGFIWVESKEMKGSRFYLSFSEYKISVNVQ